MAAGATALAAAVLGYGAWHAHTHATVGFYLSDQQGHGGVRDAELLLRDAHGDALAQVQLHPPHGLARYVGTGAIDCSAEESRGGPDWQRCFEAQSRWFAHWAARVASADLRVGDCRVTALPLSNTVYGDWWLWWVPLPHVGGKPYRHVSLRGALDVTPCAGLTAP